MIWGKAWGMGRALRTKSPRLPPKLPGAELTPFTGPSPGGLAEVSDLEVSLHHWAFEG